MGPEQQEAGEKPNFCVVCLKRAYDVEPCFFSFCKNIHFWETFWDLNRIQSVIESTIQTEFVKVETRLKHTIGAVLGAWRLQKPQSITRQAPFKKKDSPLRRKIVSLSSIYRLTLLFSLRSMKSWISVNAVSTEFSTLSSREWSSSNSFYKRQDTPFFKLNCG